MTRRVRVVSAHLPHPVRVGDSLCGEVSRIRACAACEARRDALLQVHVQSPRKPGHSFCGQVLIASPSGSSGSSDPPEARIRGVRDADLLPPMYLSAERARDVLADAGSGLPICPGCSANLVRFDEAMRKRTRVQEVQEAGGGRAESVLMGDGEGSRELGSRGSRVSRGRSRRGSSTDTQDPIGSPPGAASLDSAPGSALVAQGEVSELDEMGA